MVWGIHDYDGDPSDILDVLTFEVRRDGVLVAGTMELVLAGTTGYAVWHPDNALDPGAYEAVVEVPAIASSPQRSEAQEFQVVGGTVEPLDLSALGARLQPSAYVTTGGRQVCCEVPDDICGFDDFEVCEPEEYVQLPELTWDGLPEARRPYTLVRTWLEVSADPAVDGTWSSWLGSPYEPTGQAISTPADTYCVRIEVLDLLDGSVTPAEECIEHYDVDTFTTPNDLDAFVRGKCDGSPGFWQDSGERFRPDTGMACSVGSDQSGWGALLLLIVLARLGRRRRA